MAAAENNNTCSVDLGNNNVYLTEDLVISILMRLSFKSLVRFQSVSKPWKLLISLVEKQVRSKIPPESLFVLRDDDRFKKEYNLPFDIEFSVGSANGIICFLTLGLTPHPLLLFNPSIRYHCALPLPRRAEFYGFCYLPQTKEYKLVGFTLLPDGPRNSFVSMTILTLGMKNKYIREVDCIALPGMIDDRDNLRPASFETCMVWLGYDRVLDKRIVICYDVVEDRFCQMDLPPYPTKDLRFSFRALNNCVVLFVSSYIGATYFEIWTLINDDGGSNGKSWIKYKKVGPSETPIVVHPIHVSSDLKLIICRKNRVYHPYSIHRIRDLLYYDLETNQVINYEAADPQIGIRDFVSYVESFVSPYGLYSVPMWYQCRMSSDFFWND